MLAFPSESSDPGISVAFKNWHHDCQPSQTGGLLVADSKQRAVCNCLDKTVAQSPGRYTKCPGSIGVGDQLDNVWARGPRMDQRAAERFEKLAVCGMPGSLHGDLAGTAGDDILMTFAAALGVVSRPKALGNGFDFFVNEPVVIERSKLDKIVLV